MTPIPETPLEQLPTIKALRYVVIIGDPSNGFRHYGPFDDALAASEWSLEKSEPAFICLLMEPA